MRVRVVTEARLNVDSEGRAWSRTGGGYDFWSRYLDVFDEVTLVARANRDGMSSRPYKRVDGPGISVFVLPYYVGPSGFVRRAPALRRATLKLTPESDAVIFRVPSAVSNVFWKTWTRDGRPFGLEVVGDPQEVFAPGAVRHPLRRLFRWWTSRHLKLQCRAACAVSYVTETTLKDRYPASPTAFQTSYSSIAFHKDALRTSVEAPAPSSSKDTPVVVTVGSLEQLYKGTDVLISAIAKCGQRGCRMTIKVVGDGRFRKQLEDQAKSLGICCEFVGQLPGPEAVRRVLDKADLFVLPSRTEGLPRAMIEAMGRGLPCIGSTVGGIPDLLPPEDMVPPGDADALAAKIEHVLGNPARQRCMSTRNLHKAMEYLEENLRGRRIALYRKVRDATQEWILARDRAGTAR